MLLWMKLGLSRTSWDAEFSIHKSEVSKTILSLGGQGAEHPERDASVISRQHCIYKYGRRYYGRGALVAAGSTVFANTDAGITDAARSCTDDAVAPSARSQRISHIGVIGANYNHFQGLESALVSKIKTANKSIQENVTFTGRHSGRCSKK